MILKKSFIIILSLLVGFSASAQIVFDDELDQTTDGGSSTVGTSIVITPTVPSPNQTVSAEVRDFSVDLNSSTITWFVNGSETDKGIGKTNTSFQIGGSGATTTVRAFITPLSGQSKEATTQISVADVDLVWTANTYTPPLYKGKSLYSPQSSIVIAAIPQFPNNSGLIYTWKNGNTVLGSQSGAGRNTLVLSGSILGGSQNISVKVTSSDKKIKAVSSANISPRDVNVVVYEDGEGIDNAITDSYILTNDSVRLRAVPYYISSPSAQYTWSVNGQATSNTSDLITLNTEGRQGVAQIDVSVKHIQNFLQSARESLIINFR